MQKRTGDDAQVTEALLFVNNNRKHSLFSYNNEHINLKYDWP